MAPFVALVNEVAQRFAGVAAEISEHGCPDAIVHELLDYLSGNAG